MQTSTVESQPKFRTKPLTSLKTCDLIYLLFNTQKDPINKQIWLLLKTRTLSPDSLKRIAKNITNDDIALEAYDMYMLTHKPEEFYIYSITNFQVAAKAAAQYLKRKSLTPYEISKIIYECKNEQLALIFFKAYCKRFQKTEEFDEFLVYNAIEGWCSNRHNAVALLAYTKLKNQNLLTLDNLTSMAIKGYSNQVRLKAVQQLLLLPELTIAQLYRIFEVSKDDKVIDMIVDKFELLYLQSLLEAKKIIDLLTHDNRYNYLKWLPKLWTLIQYNNLQESEVLNLLKASSATISEPIWLRHIQNLTFSSYNLYLIMTECPNQNVRKLASISYINHPKTSTQSLADAVVNKFSYDTELIQLSLDKLDTNEGGYNLMRTLLNLITKSRAKLDSALEAKLFEKLKTDFDLSEDSLYSLTVRSNSFAVCLEAFKLYAKKVQLTKHNLTQIIVNCQNLKLKDYCIKMLFCDFQPEITEKTLLALLHVNNSSYRQKFWNMFLAHEDVDYYDIQSIAKYNESYTLKSLALETLNTPYYLTLSKYANTADD